jgi:CDP-ribitol ribitolphosphotransferase
VSGRLIALRAALVRASFFIGRRRPLRDRVLLATAHHDTIGGNLAVIRDGLARSQPPVPVVVLADRSAGGWRGRLRSVVRSLQAGYHLATAKVVVVDDYYFPLYVVTPREGTIAVQTWHASGAFKKFGYSVGDKGFGLDAATADRIRIHSNYDVCLIGSMNAAPAYAEAFGQPLERFRADLGIPRTDVLFGEERTAATIASLRQRYAIPTDRRVILYAPTFRGQRVTEARFPTDLDLALLHERLGEDHVVLVRSHPLVQEGARPGASLGGFAIDVSDHPDVNELLLVSDVLVTDYSSVIFEYALLGRPMLFFAPDLDAYERERGFYADYRSWVPGPVLETTEGVATALRAGSFDLERVRAFREASFEVADGHATERFIEGIVRPALR